MFIDVEGAPGAIVATKVEWADGTATTGDGVGAAYVLMRIDGLLDGDLAPRKNVATVVFSAADGLGIFDGLRAILTQIGMRLALQDLGLAPKAAPKRTGPAG